MWFAATFPSLLNARWARLAMSFGGYSVNFFFLKNVKAPGYPASLSNSSTPSCGDCYEVAVTRVEPGRALGR